MRLPRRALSLAFLLILAPPAPPDPAAAAVRRRRPPPQVRGEVLEVSTAPVAAQADAPPKASGWTLAGSSLLLRSPRGGPSAEFGLGRWEEAAEDGSVVRKTMLGAASGDGRFAWHWEKTETIRRERQDRVLSSSARLSYLGSTGRALWTSEAADAPEGLGPMRMSRDGEWALLFEREGSTWTIAAVTFIGNRLLEVEGAARILRADLSSSGKFALLLWGPYDKPLVCTLLDLPRRARKDIAAAGLAPGELSLSERGSLSVEGKEVFRW